MEQGTPLRSINALRRKVRRYSFLLNAPKNKAPRCNGSTKHTMYKICKTQACLFLKWSRLVGASSAETGLGLGSPSCYWYTLAAISSSTCLGLCILHIGHSALPISAKEHGAQVQQNVLSLDGALLQKDMAASGELPRAPKRGLKPLEEGSVTAPGSPPDFQRC